MNDEPKLTKAQAVTWALYIQSIQAQLNEQYVNFAQGFQMSRILMWPPCAERVAIVEKALREARADGIRFSARVLVDVLDGIDNSPDKKIAAVKRIYTSLSDKLDQLKNSEAASQTAEQA